MKCLVQFIFLISFSVFLVFPFSSHAQDGPKNVYNYDLVYMNNGTVLKGDIVIFEEEDGDITFKDLKGRTYSITRTEYKYFKENVRYYQNDRDTTKIRIIKERKIDQFEVSVGFNVVALLESLLPVWPAGVVSYDDTGIGNPVPIIAHIGVGKYFQRRHYAGVGFSYGLLYDQSDVNKYMSVGLKYKYQYDSYRNNFPLYLIGSFNYTLVDGEYRGFYVQYDQYNPNGRGRSEAVQMSLSYPEVGIGHGVSFMLRNKKSISLEASITRSLSMNEKVKTATTNTFVESGRAFSTLRFSLMFNL